MNASGRGRQTILTMWVSISELERGGGFRLQGILAIAGELHSRAGANIFSINNVDGAASVLAVGAKVRGPTAEGFRYERNFAPGAERPQLSSQSHAVVVSIDNERSTAVVGVVQDEVEGVLERLTDRCEEGVEVAGRDSIGAPCR